MAAPTFISATQTVWDNTTSPKTTASISLQSGDKLIAIAATSSWQTSDLQTNNPTISDSALLTWTKLQEVAQDQYCGMVLWSSEATSTTSITVTFTHVHTNTGIFNGGIVIVFRGSSGASASTSGYGTGVVPNLNLTTTYGQSAIIFFSADWDTASNPSRTWTNVNDYTPTSGNGYELVYNVAGSYTLYCAYWPNVGIKDIYNVGMYDINNPPLVTQKSSHVAVEVLAGAVDLGTDSSGAVTGGSGTTNNIDSITNISTITL